MPFPFSRYWTVVFVCIVVLLICLLSALAAQFYLSLEETNMLPIWLFTSLVSLRSQWVVPITTLATTLAVFSAIMIIRDMRKKRRGIVVERIRSWARNTIMLLVNPISDEPPDLELETLKTKFQAVKSEGLNAVVDSAQVNREFNERVWTAVSSILRFSDAFSKMDDTFDFKGELINLLEKLQDIIKYSPNK